MTNRPPIKQGELNRLAAVAKRNNLTIEVEAEGVMIRMYPGSPGPTNSSTAPEQLERALNEKERGVTDELAARGVEVHVAWYTIKNLPDQVLVHVDPDQGQDRHSTEIRAEAVDETPLQKEAPPSLPEGRSPEEVARHFGISPRKLRQMARELGACRIVGNKVFLLPADVEAILEAAHPKPEPYRPGDDSAELNALLKRLEPAKGKGSKKLTRNTRP
ncbi:helix-turn-helix domain-containing protein [Sinorhizobium meliloti]|uniref:helix-turn-helix domain-containing protein n=1 Tax=Rhizobium meliloti TaxID=382 RepID=UPI001294BE9F|nr:helix-turn-helix domain-containing protein [Sinorhizobium meliloti]MDX0199126.1 DNA-binding protein [Sinorhizobium meliloti]MDX0236483.1 DNA-binding protein [Sinorhizobium meliloti]MQU91816.1 DNA-binding protein [Sinorhizobium meliloti]